jgi:MFS family permease
MKKKELAAFIKENRNFSRLWASQILSAVTINIINFTMITRIYEKTGSTLAVSFLWIFYFLPSFFLGPFSGFFVDLWNRRKILIYTNVLQSLIILLFLIVGGDIYPIYPIVFLYSLVDEFYIPAQASSIPWLVKKKDLPFANSLFMLTTQSALVIGLGFGGIFMRLFGQDITVIVASFLLMVAAVSVYFLPKTEPLEGKIGGSFPRFWSEIRAGYLFIKNTRIILFPLLLTVLFQIFMVVLGVTIPDFANSVLNIQVQDAGPLLIVPLGLGALSGALLLAKVTGKLRKRTLMKYGFTGSFIVLLIFSLILPHLGRYKTLAAIPLMLAIGLFGLLVYIPNQTLVQEKTPRHLRGRVFGTLGFLIHLSTLPFLLFTATIVDLIGVRLFMFLASLIVFSMLIFFDKVENYILSKKVSLSVSTFLANENK